MDPADPEIRDIFLREIDGMIEATEEFIADDKVTPLEDPDGRLFDRTCLHHVRNLYTEVFSPE